MSQKLQHIDCILFDLGGVVINIDWRRSVIAFAELTGWNFEDLNILLRKHELVQKIETGEMSPSDFRNWFRDFFNVDYSNQQIDLAWNAMLMDIPFERVELIERLKNNFKIMCLSNTNAIHIDEFNSRLRNVSGYKNLEELMHKTYYSHLLKTRKPNPESWEFIINENQLEPKSVLYFDDNERNHQVALELGINSILISPEYTIEDYFHE